jgi:hypothetical protein
MGVTLNMEGIATMFNDKGLPMYLEGMVPTCNLKDIEPTVSIFGTGQLIIVDD